MLVSGGPLGFSSVDLDLIGGRDRLCCPSTVVVLVVARCFPLSGLSVLSCSICSVSPRSDRNLSVSLSLSSSCLLLSRSSLYSLWIAS
jgi:hypothetical protein